MDIVLRAAAAFVLVFGLLRVTGRRELSTLEPFDLILLVVIGDLVQPSSRAPDRRPRARRDPARQPCFARAERGYLVGV